MVSNYMQKQARRAGFFQIIFAIEKPRRQHKQSRGANYYERHMNQMTNTVTAIQPQTSNNISTWNIDPAHTVAEFKVKHMMIANVKGHTKISRKDFGLTWNAALETGGILVGDDVTITLEAEFVKA